MNFRHIWGAAEIRWGRLATVVGFVVGFAASISLACSDPSQAYRFAGVTLAAGNAFFLWFGMKRR